MKILNAFNSIPLQLAKENKKFQYSKIAKGARSRDYVGVVEWLYDAGIINICKCLNVLSLPLRGNERDNSFKLYMRDTGLFIAMLDYESAIDIKVNKNLNVYKGALYENIVAESFSKQGLDLYYYKKEDSQVEEDFFIRTKDKLVPVEVKSNDNRSKSLKIIMNSGNEDIDFAVKLSNQNIGFENNIYTFPYWLSFLIKKWKDNKFI